MKSDIPRFARVRAVAVGALALTSLLVACEASLPTSAQVDAMDAASAEQAAVKSELLKSGLGSTVYVLDSVIVTASAAHAVLPSRISSVQITKSVAGKPAEVRISTKPREGAVAADSTVVRVRQLSLSAPKMSMDGAAAAEGLKTTASTDTKMRKFSGIYFIDGVRAGQADVEALNPKNILGIEIVKAAAATAKYSDPLAANGVISITTRSGKNQ